MEPSGRGIFTFVVRPTEFRPSTAAPGNVSAGLEYFVRPAVLTDARTALTSGCDSYTATSSSAAANTNTASNAAVFGALAAPASLDAQSVLTQLCGGLERGCWVDAATVNGATDASCPSSPHHIY